MSMSSVKVIIKTTPLIPHNLKIEYQIAIICFRLRCISLRVATLIIFLIRSFQLSCFCCSLFTTILLFLIKLNKKKIICLKTYIYIYTHYDGVPWESLVWYVFHQHQFTGAEPLPNGRR